MEGISEIFPWDTLLPESPTHKNDVRRMCFLLLKMLFKMLAMLYLQTKMLRMMEDQEKSH